SDPAPPETSTGPTVAASASGSGPTARAGPALWATAWMYQVPVGTSERVKRPDARTLLQRTGEPSRMAPSYAPTKTDDRPLAGARSVPRSDPVGRGAAGCPGAGPSSAPVRSGACIAGSRDSRRYWVGEMPTDAVKRRVK